MFILTTIAVESFDLKCSAERFGNSVIGDAEFCKAYNLKITSKNEEITSVNGRRKPTTFQGLYIKDQTVHYLPKGIDKLFPNLKGLIVWSSHLKSLTQNDLKPMRQLVHVDFMNNDLESLDRNLFDFNLELTFVGFADNKLKKVGMFVLAKLKKLKSDNFSGNPPIIYE